LALHSDRAVGEFARHHSEGVLVRLPVVAGPAPAHEDHEDDDKDGDEPLHPRIIARPGDGVDQGAWMYASSSTSSPTRRACRPERSTGPSSSRRNPGPAPPSTGATKARSLSTSPAARNAVA